MMGVCAWIIGAKRGKREDTGGKEGEDRVPAIKEDSAAGADDDGR